MLTRPIPSTGEKMPVIGLGTWPVFDVGADDRSREPLRGVVRRLVEAGGSMIDTSPMYGRAEGVTGDIVAELALHKKVFLATKVWISGRDNGIAQMARSAALLKSPVIDLMQVHNLVDWRTQLATIRDMKAEGTLRYIGITHYTTGSLTELARILEVEDGIDFVQCGYSLATRAAETRLANRTTAPFSQLARPSMKNKSSFSAREASAKAAGSPASMAPSIRSCRSMASSRSS